MAKPAPDPEFSRTVSVDALEEGDVVRGEADAAERAALAARYGALSVEALDFDAAARPWGKGGWLVEGRVRARVTQACVVTLEPVDGTVDEPFERRFLPPEHIRGDAAPPLDAADPPEPLGEAIDFGEIAAEAAALGLDPYPRLPGAALDAAARSPGDDEEADRPFAPLAALRRRDGDS